MVRRAAANSLKAMIEGCTPAVVESHLLPLFLRFLEDDQVSRGAFMQFFLASFFSLFFLSLPLSQRHTLFFLLLFLNLSSSSPIQDSVRLLGVGLLPTLAKILPPASHPTHILPQFNKAVGDASWRVRYMLADIVIPLQAAVDPTIAEKLILPAFVKVLVDPEAEVRNCAASKVGWAECAFGGNFIIFLPLFLGHSSIQ